MDQIQAFSDSNSPKFIFKSVLPLFI